MKHSMATFIVGMMTLMCGGCATSYVAMLRGEYSDNGKVCGVYYGNEEYPCLYPATRISLFVEIPTWWCPSGTEIGRGYVTWLWPIGAPLSVVDAVCSITTDTIMLPYDCHATNRKVRR